MLNLPLEPTDDDRASPAFKNPASCRKWLDQLQLTNVQAAHTALRKQLDEFNRCAVRSLDRMQTLEVLQETIENLQKDYSKRVYGKPLPLDKIEFGSLIGMIGLWQGLFNGYLRCLQAYQDGDRQLKSYGSVLCHRCMLYTGKQIFDFLHAGHEFAGAIWQQLHALFVFAEENSLLSTSVQDEHDRRTTCHDTYLKILLSCLARPQELTRTQQQLLDDWLSLWAPTITIDRNFTISKGDAPPLAINLAGTHGLQQLISEEPMDNPNMRYLAMVPVSKQLRVKTIMLQQGHTPKQVELGDDVRSEDCIELLTHVHKFWCEPRPQRAHERYDTTKKTTVCFGLENIYSCISNQSLDPKQTGARETWQTEEVSLLGARLLRLDTEGMRINANRIIAARIEGDEKFRLGHIVWVSVMRNEQLHMGIRFMPGVPQALVIKDAPAVSGEPKPRNAAMLLPAMSNLGIPASLIIPRNIFKPGLELEIAPSAGGEKAQLKVRLGFSVEKGVDYERVSFAPA
jgi:hypothetical protein